MSGNSVNCLELAIGVVIPEDFSVRCRVSANVTIERTRKHGAGNRGHRGGLGRTAWPSFMTTRRRYLPDPLTVVGAKREHTATLCGVQFILPIIGTRLQCDLESHIRQGDIKIAAIRR